jgi:hypothetical protein
MKAADISNGLERPDVKRVTYRPFRFMQASRDAVNGREAKLGQER